MFAATVAALIVFPAYSNSERADQRRDGIVRRGRTLEPWSEGIQQRIRCMKPSDQATETTGNIECVLSNCGLYNATLAEDGAIAIWDSILRTKLAVCVPSGTVVDKKAQAYGKWRACTICFENSKDARVLICNREGLVAWDWKAGKLKILFAKGEHESIGSVCDFATRMAVSADGKRCAVVDTIGNVAVFEFAGGAKPIFVSSGRLIPPEWDYHVCFSSNSTRVIWNEACAIKCMDVSGQKSRITEYAHSNESSPIIAILVSKERLLSVDKSGTVRSWEPDKQKTEYVMKIPGNVTCMTVSRDGEFYAVADTNGRITIYNPTKKLAICSLKGPKSGFTRVGFLHESKVIFAVGEYEGIRYWRIDDNKTFTELKR